MFMVASSVVTTIMILNYHHRQADTHTMPPWVSLECAQKTKYCLRNKLWSVLLTTICFR